MTEESPAELQISGPPRFQFVRALGRGVLGEAYEVIDESRGDHVVLKVFLRCHPRNLDRFKLEFEALARLDHPALVKFHHLVDPASDTNVDIETRIGEPGLAFTQEYVDGVDLLTWLSRPPTSEETFAVDARRNTTGDVEIDGVISEADDPATGANELHTDEVGAETDLASQIVEELAASSEALDKTPLDVVLLRLERVVPQIAEGLEYLHRFQKPHGFLRPSNILVTTEGQAKLTDYNIVSELVYRPVSDPADAGEPVSLLCAPEQLPYVAPEATEQMSPASDLYALGTVLFEAVAGYPPAEAAVFVAGRSRGLEIPPLAELVPECPAAWADRIDALLRPDPAARPSLSRISDVMGVGRVVQLPPTVVPEPEGFVGQRRVLEALRDEAARVADERAMRFVLLEGKAGSGKSLVVDELAHGLARRGWLVVEGQCFRREPQPFQGWQQIAEDVAQALEGLPEPAMAATATDRALASRLFKVLASVGVEALEVDRLGAIDAFRRLLGALSVERPVLLHVEDLHCASRDTASLFLDLVTATSDVRCLVVGSWRTDSAYGDPEFLSRDLELSLLDVVRLAVPGFTVDEAREFLISNAPQAELGELQKILTAGRANPRLLRELLWEHENGELDAIDLDTEKSSSLLVRLIETRLGRLDKRQTAVVNLLAVASGSLQTRWLRRALDLEIGGSVLPSEQTLESIDAVLASDEQSRLIRHDVTHDAWVIGDDTVREVVLDRLTDRDRARLAGRIADAIPEDLPHREDLRFDYEHRAERIAKAVKAAARAARAAESQFAYHRAAKLWRWLLEHEEKSDDPNLRPGANLARVEHLAGEHAEAAELYRSWADGTQDRMRRAAIRGDEASAWLQAGESDAAVTALDAAFRDIGETYNPRWHASVSEGPRRLVASLVRWNERLVERVKGGRADASVLRRATLYRFAIEYNDWLDGSRAVEIEARLARLASASEDANVLASHRIAVALIHAGEGVASRRDRSFGWLDEAERASAEVDDARVRDRVQLARVELHVRYGEYTQAREVLRALDGADTVVDVDEHGGRRWPLFWRAVVALRGGRLDRAEELGRRLLHTYRGDHLAATRAYALLTQVALLRGDADVAAVFLDAGRESIRSSRPLRAEAHWYVPRAQVHIALGRPEVAVGQMQYAIESLSASVHLDDPAVDVPLRIGLGQAAAAVAERQRVLAEPRQDATRAVLREVQRRLTTHLDDLNAIRRAEALRLFTRIALICGKPRKALKFADAAVEALGGAQAPVDVARCAEARGHALLRLERTEGRGIVDQSVELYRHCGVTHPLVLEGWPVPPEATMLKED